MKPKEANNRELGTGQYTYTNGLGRVCECGHTLGVHSATRIEYQGKKIQDCMNGDVGTGETCDCQLFIPKKV